MKQGDTGVQGDTGGYAPTLDELLEYAGQRFGDGDHLAQEVALAVKAGADPIEIRDTSARNGAFLKAYFADCVARLREDIAVLG